MKLRTKRISFPVFRGYTILVVMSADLKKALERYEVSADEAEELGGGDAVTVDAVAVDGEGAACLIFLKPTAGVDIMAHEAWHAVKYMMAYVGLEIDHETVAYHLGHVVQEIFNFVRRRPA